MKPLSGGDLAVCFLNRTTDNMDIYFDWMKNPMKDPDFEYAYDFRKTRYDIYDVWSKTNLGTTKKHYILPFPVMMF